MGLKNFLPVAILACLCLAAIRDAGAKPPPPPPAYQQPPPPVYRPPPPTPYYQPFYQPTYPPYEDSCSCRMGYEFCEPSAIKRGECGDDSAYCCEVDN